jgi:hypothetical protein
MARGPRYTPEQVEQMMIERLVEAIYPVLIPIEQQDVAIQKRNLAKITSAARSAWQSFATTQ